MRAAWLLGICACAGSPPPPGIAAAAVRVPPAAPTSTASQPPGTSRPAPNACFPTGVPLREPRPEPPADLCRPLPAALAASVARDLEQDFRPSDPGGKLAVRFGCDPLDEQIDEIVFEVGDGHGFTLELWRLTRAGDAYDVVGVAYSENPFELRAQGYVNGKPVPPPEPERIAHVARGRLPARAVDARIDPVRALLAAELEQRAPPGAGGGLGLSGWMSSHDFHLLFRLRDRAGRTRTARFTGYASSDDQLAYLPLVAAQRHIAPLLEAMAFENRAPEAAHREHFVERFVEAAPRFDEDLAWWVKERQVAMAAELGTPQLVELLLPQLAKRGRDRSTVDTKRDAVAALARITGWDARREGGEVLPLERAAARYLSECGRALGR